jgi:hypothetical protein
MVSTVTHRDPPAGAEFDINCLSAERAVHGIFSANFGGFQIMPVSRPCCRFAAQVNGLAAAA